MLTYITRRLLLVFPTLFGISALVFFSMALSPGGVGGPILRASGQVKSEDARRIIEYYQRRYGLDKPVWVQYARWLNLVSPVGWRQNDDGSLGRFGFKWPSLGESLGRHRPVLDLIEESLPLTLLLNAVSIPIVYGFGVLSGITTAKRHGSTYDHVMGLSQLASWSVPTIWSGVMLIGFFANRNYFDWFPTSGLHETEAGDMTFLCHFGPHGWERGWLLDTAWHLVLPVICLSYGGSAFLTKLTRGSILENLSADYVRTARAKGLSENVVLYRHVFRNSVLALITVAASILPAMLSGSVVVESIFSIPGMGKLGVEAVENRDRELVLAVTLIGGLLGLLSTILRDVLYAMADPRVTYE
jgi:ABC-type dipeptide/oligopeptide/nickel transport system permease component